MSRPKKHRQQQPWLTRTGVEIPTDELRGIAKSWSAATWENYLTWFETGGREKLVLPGIYDKIGEELTESIFKQFQQDASSENRDQCERALELLSKVEAEILRLFFLEGRTEAEIAFSIRRSKCRVHQIKNQALRRLKRGNRGDNLSTRQFMKGESFSPDEASIWDERLSYPLKEARAYDPNNHRAEFEQLKTSSVRVALLSLSETAQKILFLRYWCNFSLIRASEFLGLGWNVIDDIESASISKVKRLALELETESTCGGSQCA